MPEQKVFEGVIFSVHQWQQEMFDGSVETFERLSRPDTVAVIPLSGERILLAKELQPHWTEWTTGLFGGRVDPGEAPLDAAKRELLEETGLASDDWELLFSERPVHKMDWTIHYYIARDCRTAAAPSHEPGERIEVLELDFDEFIGIAKREEFRSKGFTYWLLREIIEDRLEEFRKRLMAVPRTSG